MVQKSNTTGWSKVLERVDGLGKRAVKVGIVGDKAKELVDDGAGEPITMAQLAGVHEFGAVIRTRFATILIPERSFIRATVAQNERPYTVLCAKLVKRVLAGKLSEDQALGQLGLRMAGDMQRRISEGIDPANADSTIAAKGSSTPLVDSGRLRASITSVVVDANEVDP